MTIFPARLERCRKTGSTVYPFSTIAIVSSGFCRGPISTCESARWNESLECSEESVRRRDELSFKQLRSRAKFPLVRRSRCRMSQISPHLRRHLMTQQRVARFPFFGGVQFCQEANLL